MAIPLCPMAITRNWEQEPCGKPATCVIRYEFEGETHIDPACTYHAHMMGGALPITEGIESAIRLADWNSGVDQ